MRVQLSDLEKKSQDELKKFYSQIPLTETYFEINGSFHSNDCTGSAAKALGYLPNHISTVIFSGKYTNTIRYSYTQESEHGQDGMEYHTVTTRHPYLEIGDLLPTYASHLPYSVHYVAVAFSLPQQTNQRRISFGTEALNQTIQSLFNVKTLDLFHTELPESASLTGGYRFKFPTTLKTIKFPAYSVSVDYTLPCVPNHVNNISLNYIQFDKDELRYIFLKLKPSVTQLQFAGNELFQIPETYLSAAFSKLPSGLVDFDLRKNKLGRKTRDALRDIFANLPPRLAVFGLSENEFANLSATDMTFVLQGIQGSINELDLGDNDLLLKEESDLDTILMGLPETIKKLRLCEKKLNGMSGMQLATRLRYLPAHIETFSISNSNLFGLPISEVIIALSGLQETVTTIDFSYSGLDQKTGAELAELFSGLPAHIRKIKVSFNRLADMELNSLKQGLDALQTTVIEIDLSDNGFDRLYSSQLGRLLDIIPKTVGRIILDENQFSIRNDGALISVRNTFKPHHLSLQHKFRHQKQFASLRLVMMQIVQSTSINIDLACHIFSYLVDPLLLDIKYKASLHQQINTTLVTAKPPVIVSQSMQQKCIDIVRYRIESLNRGATRLDLSRCGLNRIYDTKTLIELLKRIPDTVKNISFRGNGFQYDERGRQSFIEILKAIPQQITYLDLSDNDFEFDNYSRLKEVVTPIPSTVQYISLVHERPASPAEHLARVKSYKNFYEMTAQSSNAMEKATMILKEYIQELPLFFRMFTTDQNRHQKNEISRIIRWIDYGVITNVMDLNEELQNLPTQQIADSLSSRMSFILQYKGKPTLRRDNAADEGFELAVLLHALLPLAKRATSQPMLSVFMDKLVHTYAQLSTSLNNKKDIINIKFTLLLKELDNESRIDILSVLERIADTVNPTDFDKMCADWLVHRIASMVAKETGMQETWFFGRREGYSPATYNDYYKICHEILTTEQEHHSDNSICQIATTLSKKLDMKPLSQRLTNEITGYLQQYRDETKPTLTGALQSIENNKAHCF